MKYKGINYKIMRNTRNTVNKVYVITKFQTYDFDTIKQAKRFMSELAK